MSYTNREIRQGIKLHFIETNKFKTNLMAVFITVPLNRKTVTFNSLLPAVLKRGTATIKTQEEISEKLENMYGASFDCGIEKIGDNHVLKFYLEALNDKFIPKNINKNLFKESIELLLETILNPLTEKSGFKKEYVEAEKNNIKLLIESKIDNKDQYSFNRCIEEMYKDKPYGLYKYGYVEDLSKIDENNLYKYYLDVINTGKIDIFVSGELEEKNVEEIITNNLNIGKLKEREVKNLQSNIMQENKEENVVQEKMDISQGKLVLGLDVLESDFNKKFAVSLYNVILGESATSKLFQNVREKASLAYTARSNYIKQKNNIYIRCGIEINNYEKALKIIREQLDEMKQGKFTEEDLENGKKYIISGIQSIQDEQDSEIIYYIGQELSEKQISFEEYIEKINKVTMEDVKNVANKININTIYFLRN